MKKFTIKYSGLEYSRVYQIIKESFCNMIPFIRLVREEPITLQRKHGLLIGSMVFNKNYNTMFVTLTVYVIKNKRNIEVQLITNSDAYVALTTKLFEKNLLDEAIRALDENIGNNDLSDLM